ncbi:MAG: regulatory iron-sulfur-containing complex subunit RicT [Gemmatimonadota bacterium]
MLPLPVIQSVSKSKSETQIVEVTFKGNRRGYYSTDDEELRPGDHVIVEAERGEDLGRVKTVGGIAAKKCTGCASDNEKDSDGNPTRSAHRRAEPGDVQKLMVLRADEERVRRKAREMVEQHSLRMKVTEAEWQWDKNKLTLYFTAERRVDFRQLVRDLARTFRTRIELRQIGVRDEAALLGGVGRCGRELCCSTWLREIKPVSLQLAKDQNLSLNPAQISGTCGRLMCCLTYEHDSYLAARKRFPREGKTVRTSHGPEKVIGIDIWRDQVTLMDESRQRRVVELDALRAEMSALQEAELSGGPGATGAKDERRPRRDNGTGTARGNGDSSRTGAESS